MELKTFSLLFCALAAWAQTGQTRLAQRVALADTSVTVSNPAGIAAGDLLYSDSELMAVTAVSGPALAVSRGASPTYGSAHTAGAVVWFGTPDSFTPYTDPSGACGGFAQRVAIATGKIWQCSPAGIWIPAVVPWTVWAPGVWTDDGANVRPAAAGRNLILGGATATTSGTVYTAIYMSGIAATGTSGETCLLTMTQGTSTAVATVPLGGTNTITASTVAAVASGGSGFTSSPTSAVASAGSATCSGTATITSALVPSTAATETGWYLNGTAGDLTWPLPVVTAATVGTRLCFRNAVGATGVITLRLPASTLLDVAGVNGAAAGSYASAGAAGDSACVVAVSPTQYMLEPAQTGSWTPGT